jgi:chromosome partitioning protein
MTKVYAVLMNKGGVGKTSLITNLASLSALYKKRTLIIDTDGQGNCSLAFGLLPANFNHTVADVATKKRHIDEVIVNIDEERMRMGLDPINLPLDLAPANHEMNMLEFEILTRLDRYPNPFRLWVNSLKSIQKRYDAVFIDTPPAMGLVAGNVLSIADEIIIPFIPESFGVSGFIRVVEALKDFRDAQGISVKIAGVVGTMFDNRTNLHHEMMAEAKKYCQMNGIRLFDTVIPRSIRFASAFAYERKPATLVDRSHYLVAYYESLYAELVEDE